MSCGVRPRHSSDLAFLWLWCRLAAVAPIQPLAWKPPYAMGVALKDQKKKKNRDRLEKETNTTSRNECTVQLLKLSTKCLYSEAEWTQPKRELMH